MECARLNRYGILAVTGADARAFLHAQLTNDIEALTPGQGCYAALLDRRKAYGTEPFVGEVPRVILGLIQKIAAEAVCVPG
jgi:folate-binding Fe-S cluster repair protein YgfZ